MKSKTAPGPDGLKYEFYKALVKTEVGLQAITRWVKTELTSQKKPTS